MTDNLKDALEGIGIGLLGGLVIGLSEADWLRIVILSALFAYSGKDLLGKKEGSEGTRYKTTFTGMASFVAVIIGLYINGQHVFRESPKEAVSELITAGYSPEQARILYLKQIDKGKENDTVFLPIMQSLIRKISDSTGRERLTIKKDSLSIK